MWVSVEKETAKFPTYAISTNPSYKNKPPEGGLLCGYQVARY